jgi:ubiquinone/menaquinone biosynthesis C-methylase UbiE
MTRPSQKSAADEAVALQRSYYAQTAKDYDTVHVNAKDEHGIALEMMAAFFRFHDYKTILDVGAGTGRAMHFVKTTMPNVKCVGVEPSAELRAQANRRGLSPDELLDGDALNLNFADNSFDVVCAFGILHHIKDHKRAVSEMARVARRAVFISDANNFGQGSLRARIAKHCLRATGLWHIADWIRTGFRGYHFSEGDGVFYSYSVFDDLPIIKRKFPNVSLLNTRPAGSNFFYSAQTLALHATRFDSISVDNA